MTEQAKIELKAVFTKDGRFVISDQDGRMFDAKQCNEVSYGSDLDVVWIEFELEAPHQLWLDRPRVNLTFSMPLQAEEEMPPFVQEMIKERLRR